MRYRLRNAPPLFVGREAEVEAVKTCVARGPVTLLWGGAGMGKTAVTQKALQNSTEIDGRVVLAFTIQPGDSVVQLQLEVVRAFKELMRSASILAEVPLHDAELLRALVIDSAEQASALLIVDGLHRLELSEANALLADLAAYAVRSKWVFLSEFDPRVPELAGQVIEIGPLQESAIRELLLGCRSTLTSAELQEGVEVCRGSPGRARRLAFGEPVESKDDARWLVHGLAPADQRFFVLLSAFHVPLEPRLLEPVASRPSESAIIDLERRGVLTRKGNGLVLHSTAREILQSTLRKTPEWIEAIAAVLPTWDDPFAVLEGVRVLLDSNRLEDALRITESSWDSLERAELIPRLWGMIESQGPEFLRCKLRCAVWLGGGPALEWATRVADPPSVDLAMLRARALALAGRFQDAIEAAARLRPDPRTAAQATLLCVSLYVQMGRGDDALGLLAGGIPDSTPCEHALFLAWYMRALVLVGRRDDAGCISAQLDTIAGSLPQRTRHEARREQAFALVRLGKLAAARALVEQIESEIGGERIAFFQCRAHLLVRLTCATEGARFEEARALIARLRAIGRISPTLALHVETLELAIKLSEGDFEGLSDQFDTLARKAESTCDAELQYLVAAELILAQLYLGGPPFAIAERMPRATAPCHAEILKLGLAVLNARRGFVDHEMNEQAFERLPEALHLLASAEFKLRQGDGAAGINLIEKAIATARRDGWVMFEANTHTALCDALWLVGGRERIPAVTRELTRFATQIGSPRLEMEARFHQAFFLPPRERFRELLSIASFFFKGPLAARRARAILGIETWLDPLEQVIVMTIQGTLPEGPFRVARRPVDEPRWGEAWGLDEQARVLVLASEPDIDLSKSEQALQLLSILLRATAPLTKEEIAKRLFGVKEYHPLRHDNRVYVAMKRTRKLLERDTNAPARIVTTDTGYVLAPDVPVWLLTQ